MTSPNTNPTELDKAIEDANKALLYLHEGHNLRPVLGTLLATAKRVKELEEIVKCSGITQEHLTFTLQLLNRAEQTEDKLRMCQESKDYLQSKLAAAKARIQDAQTLLLEIKDWAYDNDYECGPVGAALMSAIEKVTTGKTERD